MLVTYFQNIRIMQKVLQNNNNKIIYGNEKMTVRVLKHVRKLWEHEYYKAISNKVYTDGIFSLFRNQSGIR